MKKWWNEKPSPKMSDFKKITTSIGSLEWPGYDEAREKFQQVIAESNKSGHLRVIAKKV